MVDNKEKLKELTLNNINLSGTNLIDIAKQKGFSFRKTEMLKVIRESKNLPKPSIAKREKSIPIKYRTSIQKKNVAKRQKVKEKEVKEKIAKEKEVKEKIAKEKEVKEKEVQEKEAKTRVKEKIAERKKDKIPYEQTKFGKMAKTVQNKHNISEKNAIRRTRKLLKIPKVDYDKLNEIDYDILTQYGY